MSSGSTGQSDLPREELKRLALLLPDDNTLRDFSAAVIPLMQKRNAALEESSRLAILRDTLLPKLISGEMRVPDAERILGEQ